MVWGGDPQESGPVLSEQEKAEFLSLHAWGLVRTERQRLVDQKVWLPFPLGYVRAIDELLAELNRLGVAAGYSEEARERQREILTTVAALAWKALEDDLSIAPENP